MKTPIFSLWKNMLKLLNCHKWPITPARDRLITSFQPPLVATIDECCMLIISHINHGGAINNGIRYKRVL